MINYVAAQRLDRAEVMQVIKTTLLRRGDGQLDPVRLVTQYWSFAGELLAEVDPFPSAAANTGEAKDV